MKELVQLNTINSELNRTKFMLVVISIIVYLAESFGFMVQFQHLHLEC